MGRKVPDRFFLPIFSPETLTMAIDKHLDRLFVLILEILLGEAMFFTVMESKPVFETKNLRKPAETKLPKQ